MFFDYLHDSIYVVAVSAASVLAADPSARRRTIRASSSVRGSAGPAACALPLGSKEGDFDAFCNGFDPSIRFADAVCADCSVGVLLTGMVYQAVKSDGWDRDRRQAQPDGRMRCGVNRWTSLYGVSNKRETGCPALRLTASRHVGLVPVPFGTRCIFKMSIFFRSFRQI